MAVDNPEDGLKKLEYLSLVSKVCTELESHTGTGDKVLAEFITELGRSSENVEEFDEKLKENGAEMPDYFVRTLLTIIHAILPPKPMDSKKEKDSVNGKTTKFKALAIADDRDRAKELQKELESEAREKQKPEIEEDDGYRDRRDRRRDRYGRNRDEEDVRRDYSRRGRDRDDEDDRRDYGRRGRDRDDEDDRRDHGRRGRDKHDRDRDRDRDRYERHRRDEHQEDGHGRENGDEDGKLED